VGSNPLRNVRSIACENDRSHARCLSLTTAPSSSPVAGNRRSWRHSRRFTTSIASIGECERFRRTRWMPRPTPCASRERGFADSLLEETGFEPLVPLNLRRRRFSEHLGVPRAAQRRKTDPRRTGMRAMLLAIG
jgi:hypothetical protein